MAGTNPHTIHYNADKPGQFLILCDHASNHVPPALNGLGVSEADRQKHIAWDPGTAYIGRLLADRFSSPAVICGVSRLVIDCNRRLTNPTLVPPESDGIVIPANQNLSREQIGGRIEEFYLPYHYRVVAALERFALKGVQPVILSIHSFTPTMRGQSRPWSIGISHTPDNSLSKGVLEALKRDGDYLVGDDEPYGAEADVDYSIFVHAFHRGLKHVQVEFRQDLVGTNDGAQHWGTIFANAVESALSNS
jgi:predicted N-formylglutamate amidohydrolase